MSVGFMQTLHITRYSVRGLSMHQFHNLHGGYEIMYTFIHNILFEFLRGLRVKIHYNTRINFQLVFVFVILTRDLKSKTPVVGLKLNAIWICLFSLNYSSSTIVLERYNMKYPFPTNV